jgi:hypothetical protein
VNLYWATNGYFGDGIVHCVVLAEDAEQALKLARESFKRQESFTIRGEPK